MSSDHAAGAIRIACITDQRVPNAVATSEQVVNMVSALRTAGAEVRLVVPRVTPRRTAEALGVQLAAFYGVPERLEVIQTATPTSAPRGVSKLVHAALGAWEAWRGGFDVVYTRNVPTAVMALLLGLDLVLEMYHVIDWHRPRTAGVLAWLSRRRCCIGVIAHSSLAREGLVRAGVDPTRVTVVPNGFNPRPMTPPLSRGEARRRLGWDAATPVACYAGRIDVDKGALAVLELAAKTPEVVYWLVGHSERGPDDWLEQRAKASGLTNVRCHAPVPPSQIGTPLYAADLLLIPPTAGPLRKYGRTVLPLKTFLYLAAGRPILAPDLPDTADVLTPECAVLVPADDMDAAAAAVRRILADRPWSEARATVAVEAASRYTWDRRAARVLAWMNAARANRVADAETAG